MQIAPSSEKASVPPAGTFTAFSLSRLSNKADTTMDDANNMRKIM